VRENDDRRTPVGYGEQKLAYESRPLRVLERDAESGWRAFGDRNSACDARDHRRYFLVGELGEVGVVSADGSGHVANDQAHEPIRLFPEPRGGRLRRTRYGDGDFTRRPDDGHR